MNVRFRPSRTEGDRLLATKCGCSSPAGAWRLAGYLSVKRTDTGGEFGVVRLFMGKTTRLARIRREIRSGDRCEGRSAGRNGEFATGVRTPGGQAQAVR